MRKEDSLGFLKIENFFVVHFNPTQRTAHVGIAASRCHTLVALLTQNQMIARSEHNIGDRTHANLALDGTLFHLTHASLQLGLHQVESLICSFNSLPCPPLLVSAVESEGRD